MSAAANVHVRRVERCYWLVGADGTIYNDGDAAPLAKLPPLSTGISAIAAAPNGKGAWIVAENGQVFAEGGATNYGGLNGPIGPGEPDIVSIVPTPDSGGYWLIGNDGNVYPYGDATSYGSLPALGVSVDNVVGAVPTAS